MHTPHTLARTAFEATGSNPDRRPGCGDVAHAVRYAVTAMLEEWGETYTGNSNTKLALESILVIAQAETEA